MTLIYSPTNCLCGPNEYCIYKAAVELLKQSIGIVSYPTQSFKNGSEYGLG